MTTKEQSLERLIESAVSPAFSRGETVFYRDHQDRPQTGKVLAIEARWLFGPEPLVVYTVEHPTYNRNRMYVNAKRLSSLKETSNDHE